MGERESSRGGQLGQNSTAAPRVRRLAIVSGLVSGAWAAILLTGSLVGVCAKTAVMWANIAGFVLIAVGMFRTARDGMIVPVTLWPFLPLTVAMTVQGRTQAQRDWVGISVITTAALLIGAGHMLR
jgi:hypothetical protein